jgi:dipeptidyl aminopeptidase/acylaminoacyl peptidase
MRQFTCAQRGLIAQIFIGRLDKYALANLISYVNAQFLIFHGDKDPLVPNYQREKLYEALQKNKVKSELIIIPSGGHVLGVMIEKYYEKMIVFFKGELGRK